MPKIKFELEGKPGTHVLQFQADAYPIINYFKKCFENKHEDPEQQKMAEEVIKNLDKVIKEGKGRMWFTLITTPDLIKFESAEGDDLFEI